MGNMSYCRFENTLNDLQDCYDAIGEMTDDDEKDLSPSEARAKKALIIMCKDIHFAFGDE